MTNIFLNFKRALRLTGLLLAVLVMAWSASGGVLAVKLSDTDIDAINGGWDNWVPDEGTNGCTNTASLGGSLDKLVQAMAYHESKGDPTAFNPRGPAYGKYQFITGSRLDVWKSSSQAFYQPGLQYANAAAAPESVQDAVEYLRFISVYNAVEGDLFAAAIYNYYPAYMKIAHADHNDPKLDFAPGGNNGLTIKKYADDIMSLIQSGQANKVPLKYSSAPDFATWLTKAGGPPTGSSATQPISADSSCGTGSGAVANNIAQTAINFSWPTKAPQSIAKIPDPEYEEALRKYNPNAPYDGADCGAFVGTVMRASGADPNYPLFSTPAQAKYILDHTDKYDIKYEVKSTDPLRAGDILILNAGSFVDSSGVYHVGNGTNGAGHTMIFVGPQPPNNFNQASASGGERMANLGPTQLSDSRGVYMLARLR